MLKQNARLFRRLFFLATLVTCLIFLQGNRSAAASDACATCSNYYHGCVTVAQADYDECLIIYSALGDDYGLSSCAGWYHDEVEVCFENLQSCSVSCVGPPG